MCTTLYLFTRQSCSCVFGLKFLWSSVRQQRFILVFLRKWHNQMLVESRNQILRFKTFIRTQRSTQNTNAFIALFVKLNNRIFIYKILFYLCAAILKLRNKMFSLWITMIQAGGSQWFALLSNSTVVTKSIITVI